MLVQNPKKWAFAVSLQHTKVKSLRHGHFPYTILLQLSRFPLVSLCPPFSVYRWKGENVSTQEVGNLISTLDIIQDCSVYGVSVPGMDGKCGMSAIVLKSGHNITAGNYNILYTVTYCLINLLYTITYRLLLWCSKSRSSSLSEALSWLPSQQKIWAALRLGLFISGPLLCSNLHFYTIQH